MDATGGDVELPAMGRTSEGNSRPVVEPVLAMEKHSMRNRLLCGTFVVLTAIIVCVASTVSTERATELGYMNCVRLWTAPSVACFSFSAFLIVATMFQPAQSATASVTHRGIFSMVALLYVCAIAIAAASIGYPSPQAVCSNCTCGVCKVFRSEEQVLEERNGTCAEKERSIAVMSNAAEPNAPTGSQLKCTAGDDKGVHPPEMCSPPEKDDITVILSDNTSSPAYAELLLTTARSLLSKHASLNAIEAEPESDPDCLPKTAPACPDLEDQVAFARHFSVPMVVAFAPVMCDGVYTYCDADYRPRLACPNRMCCSLCNMVGDMHLCANEEHVESITALREQVYAASR